MTSEGVLAETEFDRGIAATRRADQPTTYDVELGPGWQIGAGVNGGMLLATLGNALRATLEGDGHPDPLTISGYYLSASRPGPGSVRTEVLRSGRNLSTATASLVQVEDGREIERLRAPSRRTATLPHCRTRSTRLPHHRTFRRRTSASPPTRRHRRS